MVRPTLLVSDQACHEKSSENCTVWSPFLSAKNNNKVQRNDTSITHTAAFSSTRERSSTCRWNESILSSTVPDLKDREPSALEYCASSLANCSSAIIATFCHKTSQHVICNKQVSVQQPADVALWLP